MQLNKFLAQCGVDSRRKVNSIILQGRVLINHDVVREMGRVVDVENDKVFLDGQRLKLPQNYIYILLNKPSGVITAVKDDRRRKIVVDLIDVNERVFPVGRLDYNTQGALLLTNDGELAYRLTHPKYNVDKVYEAKVKGQIEERTIRKLRRGILLSEGVVVKGEARIVEQNHHHTVIEIRIHEGRKRQIRRMMRAVGHPVLELRRTRFSGLTVDDLDVGKWRRLKNEEIRFLYRHLGLSHAL